jgi:Leucine-rich repeat (LRR) protein
MSLTSICRARAHFKPLASTPGGSDRLKNPALAAQAQKIPAGVHSPNTARMPLEQWVAYEESCCSESNAREAARRIKEAQNGSTVLFLHCLHLRTVPPIENCQHVTMYDLTGNCLNQIPEDLGDLPNLKYLAVHNNGLRHVPTLKKYMHLEMLGIGCNPVYHVPASLRARGVQVVDIDTFVDHRSRSRYRRHILRQKVSDFIRSWWPGAPEMLLPWVDRQTLLLSPKYGPRIRDEAKYK